MGRSDQLFGIGAGRVLEACREAIRLVGEHARLGQDTAFAFLAEAFVARGCGACDHLSPPAGVAGRERPKPLKVRSSARDRHVDLLDPFRIESRSEEHTSELQSLMRISYAV